MLIITADPAPRPSLKHPIEDMHLIYHHTSKIKSANMDLINLVNTNKSLLMTKARLWVQNVGFCGALGVIDAMVADIIL